MAINAENVFVTDFDDRYKLAYQGKGKLRETVRVETGVIGSTKTFNSYGKGVMTEHNRGNDVVAVNADQDVVTATLKDYIYAEYAFLLDINKMKADEKQAIAESAGMATGRREDQIIINALSTAIADGSFPATQKATVSASDKTPMTVAKLRTAMQLMDDNEVDDDNRFALLAPQQINDLLGTTEVTSSDYNSVKTLVNGQVDSFLGFKIIKMGTRAEGGIPSATYTNLNYTAFFWHKQALGLAIGEDKRSMVDWVPEKTGYLFQTIYSAGAVAIDFYGIVAIQTGKATS